MGQCEKQCHPGCHEILRLFHVNKKILSKFLVPENFNRKMFQEKYSTSFDSSIVSETMGEARTSTRRTSFGWFCSYGAICSSPDREWRNGSVCHGVAHNDSTKEWGGRR
jgi:hypothetical protein